MTYAVRWTSLDDSDEHGYMKSFETKGGALEYALDYARTVAARGGEVTVAPRVYGSDVVASFIADDGRDYRERIDVEQVAS